MLPGGYFFVLVNNTKVLLAYRAIAECFDIIRPRCRDETRKKMQSKMKKKVCKR